MNLSIELPTSEFSRERRNERLRYIYAASLGAMNATLTLAGLLLTYGWEDLTISLFLAIWALFAVLTFGIGLMFWRKVKRTRIWMILLSGLTIFTTYVVILVGIEFVNMNMSVYSLRTIIRGLVDIHLESFFLSYIGAIIVSLFFKSNDPDPRAAF